MWNLKKKETKKTPPRLTERTDWWWRVWGWGKWVKRSEGTQLSDKEALGMCRAAWWLC